MKYVIFNWGRGWVIFDVQKDLFWMDDQLRVR